MMKYLMQLWLGGKSDSPAGEISPVDLWAVIRLILIVGLLEGAIAALLLLTSLDLAYLGFLLPVVVGAVEFLRRLSKDYRGRISNVTPSDN
jgi:hypothetical protein